MDQMKSLILFKAPEKKSVRVDFITQHDKALKQSGHFNTSSIAV